MIQEIGVAKREKECVVNIPASNIVFLHCVGLSRLVLAAALDFVLAHLAVKSRRFDF